MTEGISYREDFKLWWPDYDHKPVNAYNSIIRNSKDVDLLKGYCKKRRTCVQAGGHVGIWPKRLAGLFDVVYTFEPDPYLYGCMKKNIDEDKKDIICYPYALGSGLHDLKMSPHCNAGGWSISDTGTIDVMQSVIDAWDIKNCDAIILDIEGYEPKALEGALETIHRCSPVLMVEELPRAAKAIAQFMKSVGYTRRRKVHKDVIFTRGK